MCREFYFRENAWTRALYFASRYPELALRLRWPREPRAQAFVRTLLERWFGSRLPAPTIYLRECPTCSPIPPEIWEEWEDPEALWAKAREGEA